MQKIDFRGYSGDCLIAGRVDVPSEVRLTDFLNKQDKYPVHDVSVYALEDGQPRPAGTQELSAAELWAVEPTDSGVTAWRADLLVTTLVVRIEVDMPPYRITGSLHGVGTQDPLSTVYRRGRMLPLTDAVVRFRYMGQEMARETRVLVINRDRAVSIRPVSADGKTLPESGAVVAQAADPLRNGGLHPK
jgi:hypothetical protein